MKINVNRSLWICTLILLLGVYVFTMWADSAGKKDIYNIWGSIEYKDKGICEIGFAETKDMYLLIDFMSLTRFSSIPLILFLGGTVWFSYRKMKKEKIS